MSDFDINEELGESLDLAIMVSLDKRITSLEQQLAESRELENKWLRIAQELERRNEVLEEAAAEAVEAERLNRSTTRNHLKKKPRHLRFEAAMERLATLNGIGKDE